MQATLIRTDDDALAAYKREFGVQAEIPSADFGYVWDLHGWLFENVHGVLALVREGGTVVRSAWDEAAETWVLP